MNSSTPGDRRSITRALLPLLLIGIALVIAVGFSFRAWHNVRQDTVLMRIDGTQLQVNQDLLAYAAQRGASLYQSRCASCHAADLRGDRNKGAPNLIDPVWMYGTGQITELEQIILYGIRSGYPKAYNVTDMPGLGRNTRLQPNEIHDVVEYLLALNNKPHDPAAAARGNVLFHGNGSCYDCHGHDAGGSPDYGAPALKVADTAWTYGGDAAALYKSIFDGRHGLCPAWINILSFVEIRELAAFLYSRLHSAKQPPTKTSTAGA